MVHAGWSPAAADWSLLNALDLVILLAAVGAALGGYRLGFLARAAAWTGMCLGVIAAARIAPTLSRSFSGADPNRTLLITAVALLTGAFLGQLAGQALGHNLRSRASGRRRAQVDRVGGAASGVIVVFAAVWLLTPTMASVPNWPSRLVKGSLVAQQIDAYTPDPPDPVSAASKLIGEQQWADLAAQFSNGLPTGPVPTVGSAPRAVNEAARKATVKVEHDVCGRGAQDGTGFVAAPHLVVTNAHVVAGEADRPGPDTVRVYRDENKDYLPARVILFDTKDDLAVLWVKGLDAEPLPLADGVEADSTGWVYGHPGGDDELKVREFRAGTETVADVPDIYDRQTYERVIVPIRAKLAHGDSGSPLINEAGQVVGVAFAISPDSVEPLAVAIAMSKVNEVVKTATQLGANADALATGPCLEAD